MFSSPEQLAKCAIMLFFYQLFLSVIFTICVHDFPRAEVSMKVGVMEFGLYQLRNNNGNKRRTDRRTDGQDP